MGFKLYVGNLSYSTTNKDLESLFEPYGAIQSVQVIMDRGTGRSRGFGFVEMAESAEGQVAAQELNEREFQGRRLTITEANPRQERGAAGRGAN